MRHLSSVQIINNICTELTKEIVETCGSWLLENQLNIEYYNITWQVFSWNVHGRGNRKWQDTPGVDD